MCDFTNEDDIERAVLEYLVRRPQASDTIEGIAHWWLSEHRTRVVVSHVQRVMARLSAQGSVEAVGEPANRCYRLKS